MDTQSLEYIFNNEHFIVCPFLTTDRFISYCKDRGIQTSLEQLERFEQLGIFYPLARVKYPKLKIKVEYSADGSTYRDLGQLKEGEEWSGDVREEHAGFWFDKDYAKEWLEEGLLWNPRSRPFQAWSTFIDDEGEREIESFYSIFQCYPLHTLIRHMKFTYLGADIFVSQSNEKLDTFIAWILNWSNQIVSDYRKNGLREDFIASICQIISNRYYPKTQTDRRTITITTSGRPFVTSEWKWTDYCRNWNVKSVLSELGVSADELEHVYEHVAFDAEHIDPLDNWYELVTFVSVEEKRRLKGDALLAQTLYSMEHMLKMFYEEVTGKELCHPFEKELDLGRYFGEGNPLNELKLLEYLTNRYHLNPKPKLILVVEGNGEYAQFPRLAEKLFGLSFARLGIEIINIAGVGNFTGDKRSEKYGALERFIDDYHNRQTLVFVILDNEGRVLNIKERITKARSKYYPKRTITKSEYVHVWNKNIEFDNFSHDEIARAMTEVSEGRYAFQAKEIKECDEKFTPQAGDLLSKLYKERVRYDLPKPKLLEVLFGHILASPKNEFDKNKKAKRHVVELIQKVCRLASRNFQPIFYSRWEENQESGYIGDPVE